MDFSVNYQDLYELDITPNGASRTWKRLAAGIASIEPENNEEIDQTGYLDGNGYKSSFVTGAQETLACEGHRLIGDPAQDFIASVRYELGASRTTNIRYYDAGGNKVEGICTIANVKVGGGAAGGKKAFSCELHINGKPILTDRVAADALTATVAAGSATGTTSATATPGADNSLRFSLTTASVGTVYGNSYFAGGIAYTSGSDIVATAGQYLQVYEISDTFRVVKFVEHLLASGDIKA